jgi:hypothetical protein
MSKYEVRIISQLRQPFTYTYFFPNITPCTSALLHKLIPHIHTCAPFPFYWNIPISLTHADLNNFQNTLLNVCLSHNTRL